MVERMEREEYCLVLGIHIMRVSKRGGNVHEGYFDDE